MREAIRIIKDEHTAIAAVLHGLRYLARDAVQKKQPADFRVLHAMLDYIVAFPERLHHPKEDRYLFSAVRERSPGAASLIERLEAEHVKGDQMLKRLQQGLLAYERNPTQEQATEFAKIVEEYFDFHWKHMSQEEDQLLPLAERVLEEEDWEHIERAFRENDNPLFGLRPKEELSALFQRVVNIAPPPIGLGPTP